jgi:FtsZ-binding cell division protein ZapB
MVRLLEYRLMEIHDRAQRRALFDDLAADYPDLRSLLTAINTAMDATDAATQEEIDELKDEVRYLQDDLEDERRTNEELRDDVDYWKAQAGK